MSRNSAWSVSSQSPKRAIPTSPASRSDPKQVPTLARCEVPPPQIAEARYIWLGVPLEVIAGLLAASGTALVVLLVLRGAF